MLSNIQRVQILYLYWVNHFFWITDLWFINGPYFPLMEASCSDSTFHHPPCANGTIMILISMSHLGLTPYCSGYLYIFIWACSLLFTFHVKTQFPTHAISTTGFIPIVTQVKDIWCFRSMPALYRAIQFGPLPYCISTEAQVCFPEVPFQFP